MKSPYILREALIHHLQSRHDSLERQFHEMKAHPQAAMPFYAGCLDEMRHRMAEIRAFQSVLRDTETDDSHWQFFTRENRVSLH